MLLMFVSISMHWI